MMTTWLWLLSLISFGETLFARTNLSENQSDVKNVAVLGTLSRPSSCTIPNTTPIPYQTLFFCHPSYSSVFSQITPIKLYQITQISTIMCLVSQLTSFINYFAHLTRWIPYKHRLLSTSYVYHTHRTRLVLSLLKKPDCINLSSSPWTLTSFTMTKNIKTFHLKPFILHSSTLQLPHL